MEKPVRGGANCAERCGACCRRTLRCLRVKKVEWQTLSCPILHVSGRQIDTTWHYLGPDPAAVSTYLSGIAQPQDVRPVWDCPAPGLPCTTG
eukprot:scaffold110316_cov22-Tisochrysis_lutea.AAC.1